MHAGQIIRLIRTLDGVAQGELAQRLGISRAYLSQVENGRREPSFAFLKTLSKEMRVPLPLLVLGDGGGDGDKGIIGELEKVLAELIAARAVQLQPEYQFQLWTQGDQEDS
ncbi:MAG: helix-turn-helix transcriptional regulator [Sedimentisphaerales bacterium]|nr:helix-turn-helix transcriptional regulator [Sedimentisphaerales bacterium]